MIGNEMRNLLLTAFLVVFPFTALGQQGTTGELTGIVSSGDSALAGVSVTLTSSSLQGSLSTVTGEKGGYHFALLPPGDYTVLFELQGLETSRQRVRISLARATRADASLKVATISESISVAADSFDSTQVASNFRGDLIEQLPTGRTLRDITLMSPSVNDNGTRNRLLIAGAPFYTSMFLVDGAVVNDNLGGQPHDLFVEDAIEETTVLLGAISPEYGNFTGGVVSVRTRSGGNTFKGSLRTSLSNPAWTARTPWAGEAKPVNDLSQIFEATLGGFLMKDSLWFFTAGRLADQATHATTIRTNIPYFAETNETRWETKLTTQLPQNHNFVLSYLNYSLDETNVVPNPAGVLDLAGLIPARSNPATFLTAGYHSMLPASSFLEAQYSSKKYSLQGNGGLSMDRITGTSVTVLRLGNINAPASCGVCGDDQRNNDSWMIKGTHYRQTGWGTHTFLAGLENFSEERAFNLNRAASDYFIQTGRFQVIGANVYPVFDSTTLISWAPVLAPSDGTDFETLGVFLNDRWDVSSRVSLSIGARYDRNDARDTDGNRVSDDSTISPRLAASFDPRGDGAHRVTIGYGRYVSKIPETSTIGGAAQVAGNPHIFGWRYNGPGINLPGTPLLTTSAALAQLFAWFDSVGGVNDRHFLVSRSIPGLSTVIPRSLSSPTVDEATLGYALRIGRRGHLRVDVTARDWGGFYATRLDTITGQRQDTDGKPNDVSWVVNADSETSRRYRAVQLQGTWEDGALRLGGGYTWSTLRGNEDGEGGLAGGDPPNNRPLDLWYPELLGYPQRRPVGYLTGDQTHRARVWLSWDVPFVRNSLNVSILQSYDSGTAYSAAGFIDPSGTITPYEGAPRNPGYALTQFAAAGYPYYFGGRGALRTDEVFSTDVALNFELPLRRTGVFLQCDLLNVFDEAAVTTPSTEVSTLARSGRLSGLAAFNPFTTTPIEGVHYRLPSDFGKPTGPSSYQPPRTYRFSVGMKF